MLHVLSITKVGWLLIWDNCFVVNSSEWESTLVLHFLISFKILKPMKNLTYWLDVFYHFMRRSFNLAFFNNIVFLNNFWVYNIGKTEWGGGTRGQIFKKQGKGFFFTSMAEEGSIKGYCLCGYAGYKLGTIT